MAFEGLSDRLESAFKKLRSKGSLTESDVKEAMREVRLALLEADVSYKVAKDFTIRSAEIDSVTVKGQDVEKVVVAEVLIPLVVLTFLVTCSCPPKVS